MKPLTYKQKAECWDALKIAINDAINNSKLSLEEINSARSINKMMKEIEGVIIEERNQND